MASAALPAWAPLLHEAVTVEAASEAAHAERVTELVAALGGGGGPTPVLRLAEALGPFLTSEDDALRARATGVLAEVRQAGGVAAVALLVCMCPWPVPP
jgi:hypothetical protein